MNIPRRAMRSVVPRGARRRIYETVWRARVRWAWVRTRLYRGNLDALAWAYETDKGSWWHNYTAAYQSHFGPTRRAVRKVLEIGVGGDSSGGGYATAAGGMSLRMWADFFPNAQVLGIDIHPKEIRGRRISFEQGDQSDPAFLGDIAARHGPFDLVVDDGSHLGRHVIASHALLWDAVKPGGFYVIEDTSVAYHADYEGGPPGTPGTAVSLFKSLIDDTVNRYEQTFTPAISAMHIYGGTTILQKRHDDPRLEQH